MKVFKNYNRRVRNLFFLLASKAYFNLPLPLSWKEYIRQFSLKLLQKFIENANVEITPVVIEPLPFTIGLKANDKAGDGICCKVSIILPTKNAGHELDYILSKLNQQEGISSVEIIVVDSGSTDNTLSIARAHGAKVVEIKPEDFNHGETRNLGASHATGEYLVFLTQDAAPVGDYWLKGLVKALAGNPAVAASTCKSIPRSDADLFVTWGLQAHHRFLRLEIDEVRSIKPDTEMSAEEKKRVAQLDSTCACIKKEVFNMFKFRRLPYGEDIDLGIRLIEAGYGIAYLTTISIIHSHTRPAAYFFRRSYVEGKNISDLLGSSSPDPDKKSLKLDQILLEMNSLYKAVNTAISAIDPKLFNDIDLLFKTYEKVLKKILHTPVLTEENGDDSIDKLFTGIGFENGGHAKLVYDQKMLTAHLVYLQRFKEFLSIYPTLADKKDEWIGAVYKIFATSYGNYLGASFYHGVDRDNSAWADIDRRFSANI